MYAGYRPLYRALLTKINKVVNKMIKADESLKKYLLSPSISGFAHNSIYYCFFFHFITFPQKSKHFCKKSGAAVFHGISKNTVFMRVSAFTSVFLLHFFRLTHFLLQLFTYELCKKTIIQK